MKRLHWIKVSDSFAYQAIGSLKMGYIGVEYRGVKWGGGYSIGV